MPPEHEQSPPDDKVEKLLLEDYKYRAEALGKSEEGGETRVNLFIGLLTAVGGGLGYASMIEKDGLTNGRHQQTAFYALLFLLMIGIVTLLKIIKRNSNTDRCKHNLDVIRQTFKDCYDQDGSLFRYYPVAAPKLAKEKNGDPKNRAGSRSTWDWWRIYKNNSELRRIGGLAHTVAILNAALLASLAYIINDFKSISGSVYFLHFPAMFQEMLVLLTFAFAFLAQIRYIAYTEVKSKHELVRGMPTHAGGIVFRIVDKVPQYLLTHSLGNPEEWVLPKGHIKPGEGHAEAAAREVREETGVVAHPRGFLVRLQFSASTSSEPIDIKFYLLELMFESPGTENRKPHWFPFSEAYQALKSLQESQYALKVANERCNAGFRRTTQIDQTH